MTPAPTPSPDSLLSSLAALPPEQRAEVLASLSQDEADQLVHDWRRIWARPEQVLPDGDWDTWLILAGRGWGKTRTGAEAVREMSKSEGRIALVGRTAADVRDVIVEGESGVLAVCRQHERPVYEPSKRRLTFPNGALATCYSADEPDLLRGPQHGAALCDELATWQYLDEAWDNLVFGLRLGAHPRKVITTTPRPLALLRRLVKDSKCRVTRGKTFDNAANLPVSAIAEFRAKYQGTRIGRQELDGEILDDVPGALWIREQIDKSRVRVAPDIARVVVAIDPAVTSGEQSDETGIAVAGKGADGEYYVLADRTCKLSPDGWARRALIAFDEFSADRIVAEVNNGGDMVETVVRTVRAGAPYRAVRASRGKRVRAEPIAALYEQGKVHHVGALPQLEDQMCSFLPEGNERSPDRVDALVWALTDLGDASGMGVFDWLKGEAEARAALEKSTK